MSPSDPLTHLIGALEPPRRPSAKAEDRRSLSTDRLSVLSGLVLLLLVVAASMWYVHKYSVNAIYSDQWSDVNIVGKLRSGTLTFSDLWAQHNENRILFPNLVVLFLGLVSNLNVVLETYLCAALWCATGLAIAAAHHCRTGTRWFYYAPLALLFLSPVSLGDVLYGFNLSWYMVLSSFAISLFLLAGPKRTLLTLVMAIGIAVIGSFSSLQGLLIWPAGFVALLLQRARRTWIGIWVGAAVVSVLAYFAAFNFSQTGVNTHAGFHGPSAMIDFFFTTLGNVFGTRFSRVNSENDGIFLIGVVIFAIAVLAIVWAFRFPMAGRDLGVAFITFGLLFCLVSTIGRTSLGLRAESRYNVFVFMVWVGAYLVFLTPEPNITRFRSVLTLCGGGALAFLCALQLAVGWGPGTSASEGWRQAQLDRANVESNVGQASDWLVDSNLGPGYATAYLREMAGVAHRNQLSLFGTSLYTKNRLRGLEPKLVVQMLQPAPLKSLSGIALLNVGIGDVKGLVRVEFILSSFGRVPATTTTTVAVPTGYGWFGIWNTHDVANGPYLVRGTALYRGGKRIEGSAVLVFVSNKASASVHGDDS